VAQSTHRVEVQRSEWTRGVVHFDRCVVALRSLNDDPCTADARLPFEPHVSAVQTHGIDAGRAGHEADLVRQPLGCADVNPLGCASQVYS